MKHEDYTKCIEVLEELITGDLLINEEQVHYLRMAQDIVEIDSLNPPIDGWED